MRIEKGVHVRVTTTGDYGVVTHVHEDTGTALVDFPVDENARTIALNLLEPLGTIDQMIEKWSWASEVHAFAAGQQCSLITAIERLVNSGLSHR